MTVTGLTEPAGDCPLCPRLAAYRDALRAAHPDYFNRPVPAFGPADARLLIVGLAPGKAGANRTGRPFTGDYAGDLLYATLLKFGLARGTYAARVDDGLELSLTRITNAVRCVPPANRPEPAEIAMCRRFLAMELAGLPEIGVILALGRIAHEQVLTVLSVRKALHPFGHGRRHMLPDGKMLIDSYHCSRYNTNTGRLTTDMFEDVVATANATLQATQKGASQE